MDATRAYKMGREAVERGGEIVAPAFERIHAARYADLLAKNFWDGVRDARELREINDEGVKA